MLVTVMIVIAVNTIIMMGATAKNVIAMTNEERNQELFEKQKKMLDQFLKIGAIDEKQYEKSLTGLKEKMNIKKCF